MSAVESRSFTTRQLVKLIKEDNSDFEYYPTTEPMLSCIKADIEKGTRDDYSVLDCGAGDGRVLMALTNGTRYAIEKSVPLLAAMDKSIFVVGTEFAEQTLIDKKVSIIFSNPPYSCYVSWVVKIIREANAGGIYFVIPERWKISEEIRQALKSRDADAKAIGHFDFHNAERQARAKVDIVRVDLGGMRRHSFGHPDRDPFDLWFEENFKIHIGRTEESKFEFARRKKSSLNEKLENALVIGSDVVAALVSLYQSELDQMMQNYKRIEELDPELLEEMNVNISGLKGALRLKIEGLKDTYWRELFGKLGVITEKLASNSRKRMLEKLQKHIHVDFTETNARAVALWSIKNGNGYFDSQLVELMESMIEKANVVLYKSNNKIFTEDQWRYIRHDGRLDKFMFDYRMVLTRCGGINRSTWRSEQTSHGLDVRAAEFLGDVITVAGNIGFDTRETDRAEQLVWSSGKKHVFYYKDHGTAEKKPLFDARVYLNGNIHIRFNPILILRMNCEFGRLKGWLRDQEHAADELSVGDNQALGEDYFAEIISSFGSNLKLTKMDVPLLSMS